MNITGEIPFFVTMLITGLFTMLIGNIIKKKKYVDIISGYDPKYDDKDYIANLFGTNMFFMGAMLVFSSIIQLIVTLLEDKDITVYFIVIDLLIIMIMCFKMYYNMNKDRKRRNKN